MKKQTILPDIDNNTRKSMIALLNARVADAIDLKLAVKQAHWNLKGPGFIAVHELLDQISARVEDAYDTMAERVVQLDGHALGTTQVVAQSTKLEPYPVEAVSQEEHIKALSARFAAFAGSIREAIDDADKAGDAGTTDIFTQVSRSIDKDTWFIAAHRTPQQS